jgi:hypothetical protein
MLIHSTKEEREILTGRRKGRRRSVKGKRGRNIYLMWNFNSSALR